jgi:ABC-type multidrug transport system permease subunit
VQGDNSTLAFFIPYQQTILAWDELLGMYHTSEGLCQIIRENSWLIIFIVIIIIIICYCVRFYSYIPEANHVSRTYNVADILWFRFMVHVMLFPMTNICTFTLILPQVRVHCPVLLFSVVH